MENKPWDLARASLQSYRQRDPSDSVLYRVVYALRQDLEWSWEERYQCEYGVLRDIVLEALDAYLNCGVLAHGCARAYCESCGHSELIAFSCKRRGLCPSCDAKRAHIFAEHVTERVLLPYPHSHQVWSIPKRLRAYLRYDRKLSGHLYRAAWNAWSECIEDALPGCRPAAVMALHTAGDLLNFHPHAHFLGLHGGIDGAGEFHPLDSVDTEYLEAVFARELFDALRKAELLSTEIIDSMQAWQHSGFHVFIGEPIESSDLDSLRFVSRYLKKSPIALNRLELIEDSEPIVRITKYFDDGVQTRDMTPLDFLAAVTAQIPDRWEQTTRYYGLYSARTRGKLRKQAKEANPEDVIPLNSIEPKPLPSRHWATWIKKVFEIDPLVCQKCGEAMRIKALITDEAEISRLAKNLGVITWRAPPPLPSQLTA